MSWLYAVGDCAIERDGSVYVISFRGTVSALVHSVDRFGSRVSMQSNISNQTSALQVAPAVDRDERALRDVLHHLRDLHCPRSLGRCAVRGDAPAGELLDAALQRQVGSSCSKDTPFWFRLMRLRTVMRAVRCGTCAGLAAVVGGAAPTALCSVASPCGATGTLVSSYGCGGATLQRHQSNIKPIL